MAELIEEGDLIRLIEGLSPAELTACLKAGWVVPDERQGARRYLTIDVARIRFIHELRGDLGLDDEAIPVVLSLVDQLHALRHELACMADALKGQPEEIRRSVLESLAERLKGMS
jgi:chaperone modulatory protein CbpM